MPSTNPTAADREVGISNFEVTISFTGNNSAVNLFELRNITQEHLNLVYEGTAGRLDNFKWVRLVVRAFRKQDVSTTVSEGTLRRRTQTLTENFVVITFGGGFIFQGAPVEDNAYLYEVVRGAFVGKNNFIYHEELHQADDESLRHATQVSFKEPDDGIGSDTRNGRPTVFILIAALSMLMLLGALLTQKRWTKAKSFDVYDNDGVDTLSSITRISRYFEKRSRNINSSEQIAIINKSKVEQSETFDGKVSVSRIPSLWLMKTCSDRLR